jgi:hypothetical protein
MRDFFQFVIMFLIVVPALLFAQVQVEEDVVTDSVDVFTIRKVPQKSSVIAMVSSLVLPGAGHQYIGNKNAAVAFLSAEVLFILGAYTCQQHSSEVFSSARSYAYAYAGVQGGTGADDFFWRTIGKTMDSDGLNQSRSLGWNQIQDLNRTPENKYLDPNLQWRWQDESSRDRYNSMLNQMMTYHVASNFFIGAMIVNRIVAFVDARVAAQNNGKGLLSGIRIQPQYAPLTGSMSMQIQKNF